MPLFLFSQLFNCRSTHVSKNYQCSALYEKNTRHALPRMIPISSVLLCSSSSISPLACLSYMSLSPPSILHVPKYECRHTFHWRIPFSSVLVSSSSTISPWLVFSTSPFLPASLLHVPRYECGALYVIIGIPYQPTGIPISSVLDCSPSPISPLASLSYVPLSSIPSFLHALRYDWGALNVIIGTLKSSHTKKDNYLVCSSFIIFPHLPP